MCKLFNISSIILIRMNITNFLISIFPRISSLSGVGFYKKDNFSIYFPLAPSVILSLKLRLILEILPKT